MRPHHRHARGHVLERLEPARAALSRCIEQRSRASPMSIGSRSVCSPSGDHRTNSSGTPGRFARSEQIDPQLRAMAAAYLCQRGCQRLEIAQISGGTNPPEERRARAVGAVGNRPLVGFDACWHVPPRPAGIVLQESGVPDAEAVDQASERPRLSVQFGLPSHRGGKGRRGRGSLCPRGVVGPWPRTADPGPKSRSLMWMTAAWNRFARASMAKVPMSMCTWKSLRARTDQSFASRSARASAKSEARARRRSRAGAGGRPRCRAGTSCP